MKISSGHKIINPFRLFACLGVMMFFLISLSAPALAAEVQVPYENYTYWLDTNAKDSRKEVYSKPMYQVKTVLDASTVGTKAFGQLSDVCIDRNGNIYLLDGGGSRIIILDSKYSLIKEINSLNLDGDSVSFEGAQGIFVRSDDLIYLCDTENARVFLTDINGDVSQVLSKPDSPLIPEDFRFRPLEAKNDSEGHVYILSAGSYYGALLYAPDGQFISFYGANAVNPGITQVFSNIWNRIFINTAKKSASARALPFCIVDVCIDRDDFVYTATGNTTDNSRIEQIKKLNPGDGVNIQKSGSINFTDQNINITTNTTKEKGFSQDICSLDVDQDGFIYCLDSTYGRVFLYNRDCRLLSAFGGGMGEGRQAGTFTMANSMALSGSDVLVCDSTKNTITIFEITAFGSMVKQGGVLTQNGKYIESREIWESVLAQDRNCQLAYSGMARAYLAEENYTEALSFSKQAFDRETYSQAFSELQGSFLSDHFLLLFVGIVVLIGGLLAFMVLSMRKKPVIIKNKQLRLMFSTMLHPVNSFSEIKEKQQGSIAICVVLVAIYYIFSILKELCGGFMFTYYDAKSFNSLWVLAQSVGLIALWIIGNWAVSTLLGGTGKIKEIAIVTCYSLPPVILGQILFLFFSNVLMPEDFAFLAILQTVLLIYTFMLLAIGLMKIHDYTMSEFLKTSLLTVLSIAVIVFLMILIVILVQQLFGFVLTLVSELTM